MKRVRENQLGVVYSKPLADFVIHYPLGVCSSSDGHWLSEIFNAEFESELVARGYDPRTLKFTVDIDFNGPRADEKFQR